MWIKKPKRYDFRVAASIGIVLLALLIFASFRLALYLIYHSTFEAMSTAEVWSAFFHGLQFDISMIALFKMNTGQ